MNCKQQQSNKHCLDHRTWDLNVWVKIHLHSTKTARATIGHVISVNGSDLNNHLPNACSVFPKNIITSWAPELQKSKTKAKTDKKGNHITIQNPVCAQVQGNVSKLIPHGMKFYLMFVDIEKLSIELWILFLILQDISYDNGKHSFWLYSCNMKLKLLHLYALEIFLNDFQICYLEW